MKAETKNLLEVHLAVFLFGLAGLFGKLIHQSPLIIVCGRVLFAAITLWAILLIKKKSIKLKKKEDYPIVLLIGVVLAIHWITFFQSIQVSTVAIGLLMFATFPVFVTFLEPVFFKSKISKQDLVIALITIVGAFLVIPKFKLGNSITQGVVWGILSAITFALLTVLNKKYVQKYSGLVIAFYQFLVATIILLPFVIIIKSEFVGNELFLLVLLGVVFTAFAHTLFINGVKIIKAHTVSIIATLETVYGIIFAALLLGEIPSTRTVLGGLIILGCAIFVTVRK